jgi:hypothetical protein
VITKLVTGVITNSQISNIHANLETISVVRKRDEEDSAIGKIIKLFKYTFIYYYETNRHTILSTVSNLIIGK